ncbi:MAG: PAS domain S-box protein [Pseudomonadota bacterium]
MNKKATPVIDPAQLRRQAELQIEARPPAAPGSDALKQWHELQVSQIELEMQNQVLSELQRQKDVAQAGLSRYEQLYEQAPASYFSLDALGRIVRANQAAAVLFSVPRDVLAGLTFERYIAPEDQPRWRAFLAAVFADGARRVLEAALFESVPGAGKVRIEANLDREAGVCRMIVSDVSEGAAREMALQRAFVVLDSIDEGVLVMDPGNRILSVNPAFCRITGYAAEEVIGRDPLFLGTGGQTPAEHAAMWRRLLDSGSWQGELIGRRRNGAMMVAWMSVTVMHGDDGGIGNFVGVFSDITQRKLADQHLRELYEQLEDRVSERTADLTRANQLLQQQIAEREKAEQALLDSRAQLRQLAEHLATVKENERKRIAREIHDELGQNLLALRIDVSMLRARTEASHPRLHKRVDAVLDNVDTTIRSVRGIMNELRPSVLDLGLQAATEWQLGEFRKRSGLACSLDVPDETVYERIGSEAGVVLFRILQESLTNVQRHARASAVDIGLREQGGCVVLSVADDGVGIELAQRRKRNSFGLIGIAERVVALGGELRVADFVQGQGCHLTICIPISEKLGDVDQFIC